MKPLKYKKERAQVTVTRTSIPHHIGNNKNKNLLND
jgi:hypothetical protein